MPSIFAPVRRLFKAASDFQVPAGGSARSLTQDVARMNAAFGAGGPHAASFGPGVPAPAQPLDDTNTPRAWQYRVGWNLPSPPGEGRPFDFATLRNLVGVYELLAKAIDIRKDEVCSLRMTLVARDPDRRRAREVVQRQQDTIRKIEDFFLFPDKVHTWQSWLRKVLDDHFVIDAVSIHKWRTLGGELHGLRVLDGALVKPLLDVTGDRPQPPAPAYQQFLHGVPRYDFTADELIYAPKNRKTFSAYGTSPVEQFAWHINQALRYGRFVTDFFTEGTIPEGVAEAPASWTPAQIDEFNDLWTKMMAGDTRARHRLHFVPAGFQFHQFKEWTFDPTFARWLLGVTCAALDVTPTELGFEPLKGGLGGKGFAEEQSVVLKRKAIGPLTRWLCDEILNPIVWQDFDAPELMVAFQAEGEEDERLQMAQARDLAIRNGSLSIDQAVEEDGGEPPGIGRVFVYGTSVLFEPDLVGGSKNGANSLLPPAPEPTDGARSVQADAASSHAEAAKERDENPTDRTDTKSKAAETRREYAINSSDDDLKRFLRFARERQRAGTWRDFASDAIPTDVLAALNKAARDGAGADDLKALAR